MRKTATYREARSPAEEGLEGDGNKGEGNGTYYAKYRGDPTMEPESREFTLANLSDEYILDSVFQLILERDQNLDEGYVAIETVSGSVAIYRLTMEQRKAMAQPLLVRLVLDPDDALRPEVPWVHCLFFHALDGSAKQTGIPGRRKLKRYVIPSGRVLLDYRAYVRSYYGMTRLEQGDDADWLDMFVETYFSDAFYPIRLDGLMPEVRERLLERARDAVKAAEEPFKSQLKEVLDKMERQTDFAFLIQGEQFGPRQFIGVTYNDAGFPESIVEWSPHSGVVTRMPLKDWLRDEEIGRLAATVYANTAHLIPVIMVIVWGSVGVAGAAILAPGAMGALVRGALGTAVRQLAAKKITKEALKRVAPQLAAIFAEYLAAMLPRGNSLPIIGLRAFLHGFGTGTIEHYLNEVDERLVRGAKTFATAAVDRLTKGVSRVARVLMKINAAIRKLRALYNALMAVYTEERARLVAQQLDKLWRHAGAGFLIVLFVVIYVDFAYRKKFKPDQWVSRQRETFVHMIKKSGTEIAAYADSVHEEINGLKRSLAESRARDEKLSAKVGETVREGVGTLPAVADLLEGMLEELGITNWKELKEMKFLDALQVGIEEFVKQHPEMKETAVREISKALGGFVGGIVLGRKMVPESVRKQSTMFKPTMNKGIKEALSEGTFSALWQLASVPTQALVKAVGVSLTQRRKSEDPRAGTFRKIDRRKPGYGKFVADLWAEHENLGQLISSLAGEAGLGDQVRALVARASAPGTEVPSIETMLEKDDPLWPRKAVLFVLASWMYFGLDQIRAMFGIIEDDDLFGGKMSIADILEIIGLDVKLDDRLAEAMKTRFRKATTK